MAYNFDDFQTKLADLQRQYQALSQPQSFVPQPQPSVVMPTPTKQVQYVEGLSGAKLYQQNLPPNSSEIIMDKDENVFYMVSKDANGTPARKIPVGRFTLEDYQEEDPMLLTRKEFDEFKQEIRDLLSLATAPPSTETKSQSRGGSK